MGLSDMVTTTGGRDLLPALLVDIPVHAGQIGIFSSCWTVPNMYGWLTAAHTGDGGYRLDRRIQISLRIPEWGIGAFMASRSLAPLATSRGAPPAHGEAVKEIKQLTRLPDEKIARLIGVTRQTLSYWRKGMPIQPNHREQLFTVLDILKRAAARLKTPDQIAAWLVTPFGTEAETPEQMLVRGEFDRARLMAVASVPKRLPSTPEWAKRPPAEKFKAGARRLPRPFPEDNDV